MYSSHNLSLIFFTSQQSTKPVLRGISIGRIYEEAPSPQKNCFDSVGFFTDSQMNDLSCTPTGVFHL